MVDQMVLKAQQWVNSTYSAVPGYVPCAADGHTGWQTMYSLTMGLQHECGITALSSNFGPATLAAYARVGQNSDNVNIRTIVEAGLYCKGYSGGALDGSFGLRTQGGFNDMLSDMGLPLLIGLLQLSQITPKAFKALLTMDAYVLVNGGLADVQTCQRWLNGSYIGYGQYFIGPCDGHFSRDVQKSLVLAIQYQMGMSDSQVSGSIGPATINGLQTKAIIGTGSQDSGPTGWVRLFQSALRFNGYDNHWGDGGGTFTAELAATVAAFQAFCMLPQNGSGDYQTWMSLLLSTGDPDRPGRAFDCRNPLNSTTIQTVKTFGYEIVGRYLTGGTDKVLTDSEIALINSSGLSFFPIYQVSGNAVGDFSYAQGQAAGAAACEAAHSFGLPYGTVIYFSVDFDAQDTDITNAVIPHFQGVVDSVGLDGSQYAVGVYGCRNTCSRLSAAGLTSRSFVSGMSTGYSGNLGYPLPDDWAFDQIKNETLASGTASAVEIDNDIVSGRDPGIDSVTRPQDPNDGFYTLLTWLEARADQWRSQGNTSRSTAELVAQYLRHGNPVYTGIESGTVFGDLDSGFIAFVNGSPGQPDDSPLRDPSYLWDCKVDHFGASFGAVINHALPSDLGTANLADLGGWGGDLVSVLGQFAQSGQPPSKAFEYASELIAARSSNTYFGMNNYIADVDAMVIGLQCRANSSLSLSRLFEQYYATPESAKARYETFYAQRFNHSSDTATAAAQSIFDPADNQTAIIVAGFWLKDFPHTGYAAPAALPPDALSGVATAFVEVLTNFALSPLTRRPARG